MSNQTKFKVGDVVRIVNDNGTNFSDRVIGDEFVIEQICQADPSDSYWIREKEGIPTGIESKCLELVCSTEESNKRAQLWDKENYVDNS